MDAVGSIDWVRICGQDKDVGNMGVAEHGLEGNHDGTVPTRIPIWLAPDHGGYDERLQMWK